MFFRDRIHLLRGVLLGTLLLLGGSCSLPSRHTRPLSDGSSVASSLKQAQALQAPRKRDRLVGRALATLTDPEQPTADVDLRWIGRSGIDPADFERVIPAGSVRRRGWRRDWISVPGVGSPMILLRKPKEDRFAGTVGEALPVTAVADFSRPRPELLLYDVLDPQNAPAELDGPALARDYTAPLAYLLRRDEIMPELRALLNSGRYLDRLGLFRIDPYDPDKIPVIAIHGLKSTPRVWANLANSLNADPVIRDRYQLWAFSYPTGVPILYSAMRLRAELQAMRNFYDPSHSNPNMDNMVLVGHSMGGILSRLMLSSSNEALKTWTPRPLDALGLSPEMEALTRETLQFEPQSYIGRAVFIASPHCGSEVAQRRIVSRLTGLIRVPQELKSLALATVQLDPDLSIIPGEIVDKLHSIEDLRPDSEFMTAMAHEPISGDAPYHSIIAVGRRGEKHELEETDDGLVSYKSAHLEGAASELIIPGPHNIFDHEDTIAEVKRILKLHLTEPE